MNRTTKTIATLGTTAALVGVTATVATAAPNTETTNTAPHTTVTSWPASNTGGLILRDTDGNDLGSGIGEQQSFEFVNCGPDGSGLIRVRQITRGEGGGWGHLYEGHVKADFTQRPDMYPCT